MHSIEHMFGHDADVIGLRAGGDPEYDWSEAAWFDRVEADVDLPPEPDRHLLPPDLEMIPPGPALVAWLSAVDRKKLNGHDAVRLMEAEQRLASHHEAGKLATMYEVAHAPPGGESAPVERTVEQLEYADAEIAAALTLTRRAAQRQLSLALSLGGRLKRVWHKMQEGRIDARKAQIYDDQLGHLDDGIVEMALDRVENGEHLTTGQLNHRLAKTVMELDPEGVETGYQKGVEDRRVVVYPNPDHTATVTGQSLAAEDASEILARLNELAMSLKRAGDPRSLDQIRADIFVDLLLDRGQYQTTGKGGAHLNVDLTTLAGLSDTPGELGGYGPVFADIARQTALQLTDTPWTWTVDQDGQPVATGTTKRRPDAQLIRGIRARYTACVFPGCRMPSYQCDLDHRHQYSQGGETSVANLAPLCRYHHMTKHHTDWDLERLANGDHQWTSPHGHRYVVARSEPKPSVPRPPPKQNE